MTIEKVAKICEARDTLCAFCQVLECDKCIVTHLVNDAFNEVELPKEETINISELGYTDDEYELLDRAVEFMTDKYEYCIVSCDLNINPKDCTITIGNIEWDITE